MTMTRHRTRGFTLIEIAIVLAIASLLIAAGIGLTSAVLDNARARATKQNMDSVKLALQAFIARYGYLPCPAVETLAPTSATYGIADTRTTVPATSCTNTVNLAQGAGFDAAKRGVVPWKTLGLSFENSTDGWGNQFTYMVSVTSTTLTFDTLSGARGSLYVHSATPVVAGLPATGNQINACSTTADDNACNRAAVIVLISHGRNVLGAYPSSGVRAPLPTDAGEIENTNADRFVVRADQSGTFDDVVQPLTPDDLLAPLAAQGAIKSERAVFQERTHQWLTLFAANSVEGRNSTGGAGTIRYPLPVAITTAAYAGLDAARFPASCDLGTPATVGRIPTQETYTYVPPAGPPNVVVTVDWDSKVILDPWGREFYYQKSNPDIFVGESCPHPAVIVSAGPNGALGGGDDLIYYVPLAELKDTFNHVGW